MLMKLRAGLIVALLAGPATGRSIVDRGQSSWCIVVEDNSSSVRWAAEELRRCITGMTGARLLILPHPRGPAFYLSTDESVPPAGFRITSDAAGIHIGGNNSGAQISGNYHVTQNAAQYHGTVNGVVALLDHWGCRWYFPGDLGEIIPHHDKLELPDDYALADYPYFPYRVGHRGISTDNDDFKSWWWLHTRQGNELGLFQGHYMDRITRGWCDPKSPDYRPDAMAMYPTGPVGTSDEFRDAATSGFTVEGRRCRPKCQVCTTNPKTIEGVARFAINYFDHHSDATTMPIGHNDGQGFCQCLHCRMLDGSVSPLDLYGDLNGDRRVNEIDREIALQQPGEYDLSEFTWTGDRPRDHLQYDLVRPALTDRMIEFDNAVAEQVAARFPTRRLVPYVYGDYGDVPVREHDLNPILVPCLARNTLFYVGGQDSTERQEFDQLFHYWGSKARGRIFSYTIACWSNFGCPQPLGQTMVDWVTLHRDNGFLGGLVYMSPSAEEFGPDSYLWTRLMWDPDADPTEVLTGYFRDLYGPAAPSVQEYYNIVAGKRAEAVRDIFAPGVGDDRGLNGILAILARTFAPDERLAAIEQKCARLVPSVDHATAERLTRLLRTWRLADVTAQALRAGSRLDRSPAAVPDAGDLRLLVNALDERERILAQIATYGKYGQAIVSWIRADEERNSLDPRLSKSHPLYVLGKAGPRDIPVTWGRATFDRADANEVTVYPTRCRAVVADGAMHLQCTEISPKFGAAFLFKHIPVPNAGIIRVSMEVKARSDRPRTIRRGAFTSYVDFFNGTGKRTAPQWRQSKLSEYADWTHYNHYAVIPADAKDLLFRIYVYTPDGQVDIDDLEVDLFTPRDRAIPEQH